MIDLHERLAIDRTSTTATVANSSTTPLASDSGSVSPTLAGSPPDETPSVHPSLSDDIDFALRRKRRRIEADYLIDVAHPRPLKLARQSLVDPAPDHDRPMRYTNANEPGPSANGLSNGHTKPLPAWTTLYKDSEHDREQVVRTLLQALRDVGYTETVATLERESGYKLESNEVAQLRHSIKMGGWDEAATLLRRLSMTPENERAARFLISQQKYLEQLEAVQPTAALQTLRGELAVYCNDSERLHYLSSLIMCANGADVMERARWDGARGTSRDRLLTELQRLISPAIMLPPRRLDTLLTHAKAHQRSTCTYHQTGGQCESFSLYVDHSCTRAQFPTLTTHILAEHLDEVWRLEWSHDGRHLASASPDKTAIIWKIGDLQAGADPTTRECIAERVLSGHDCPVNALAWSPDDTILLTSSEQVIKMWDVASGTSLRDLQNDSNSDMISGLVWLPDGSGFASGSMDCHIVVWSSTGQKMYELGSVDDKPLEIRVTDLTITPDGSRLIAVGTLAHPPPANTNFDASRLPRSMKVFSLVTKTELFSVGLSNEITSVKATADSRYVLVSHAPDEVQLWDLNTRRMCQRYMGHNQGRHVIRSCLGGADESFILSGSEDQSIFIWRRGSGTLLEVLKGHGGGCVNDVAWSPREPGLFASCSDDGTIRLWCPPPPGLLVTEPQEYLSR